jgi:hypothetical protein
MPTDWAVGPKLIRPLPLYSMVPAFANVRPRETLLGLAMVPVAMLPVAVEAITVFPAPVIQPSPYHTSFIASDYVRANCWRLGPGLFEIDCELCPQRDVFLGERRLAFFQGASMSSTDISNEVQDCEFGDVRLSKRLCRILERLGEKPSMSIPSACDGRAEMEAAYRFFDNKNVSAQEIFDSHARATVKRIRGTKIVLLVQDTTEIDLTRPDSKVEGAGPLNSDSQLGGLYHPMMAFEPSLVPLGTVWNKRWVRESIHKELTPEEKDKARKKLPIEEKESFRWLEGWRKAIEIAKQCPDTCCVCIGDSESDIYELFAEPCQTEDGQAHLLIRGCYDRSISCTNQNGDGTCNEAQTLLSAVRSQPVLATQTIDISKRKQKNSANKKKRTQAREARTATVSIRATTVKINRPQRCDSSIASEVQVNVVFIEETDAPEGQTPIQWLLITTLPIGTLEEVQAVINYYCCRWQIEIYFRTLKSGCRIEERYFERYTRLENCLAVYTIIAWRILYLCRLSEDCPDLCCEVVFSPSEWKPLVMIVTKSIPAEPPRLRNVVKMIASLGGYVIRSTTKPGTQTLWLGLQRLNDFATAWEKFGPDTHNKNFFDA